MEQLIAAFPQNIQQAFEAAKELTFSKPTDRIENIVLVGMGGSGIGAKIVSKWVENEINIPVLLFQEYNIPKFVNKHTLFIACSYSGNTEETLFSVAQAKEQGAQIKGICSGGKLEAFCKENNFDCVVVPGGNPPRTTTAFSIVHIVNLLVNLELIDKSVLYKVVASTAVLENNITIIKEEAKNLAAFLHTKIGVYYASSDYEAVVIRAKQQFNENSKELCIGHVIPEMNHNELVGWSGGTNQFAAVFLDSQDLIAQNKRRFEVTMDEAKRFTQNVKVIHALGENQIEKSFYFIHIIDWASLFLAELKGVDPVDIRAIDYLKNELSKL